MLSWHYFEVESGGHSTKRALAESIRDKVFKNGPTKICRRQPLKNFTWSILEYFVSYSTLLNDEQRIIVKQNKSFVKKASTR